MDITNLIKIDTHKAFIEKAGNLTFIYLNARSCRNKTLEINDLILEKNADLLFISETWLSKDDSVFTNEMLPNGYDILSHPRLSRSGGGVAIIYRASLKVITIPISSCSTFEACCLKSVTLSNSLVLLHIYRPCASKKNNTNFSNFITDFNDFLELFAPNDNIYIFGDFNIHFEKRGDPSTRKFKDLVLDELSLQQPIAVPTHKDGHTLDLLLMRDSLFESPAPSVLDMALSSGPHTAQAYYSSDLSQAILHNHSFKSSSSSTHTLRNLFFLN